jgi:hypothetical protein
MMSDAILIEAGVAANQVVADYLERLRRTMEAGARRALAEALALDAADAAGAEQVETAAVLGAIDAAKGRVAEVMSRVTALQKLADTADCPAKQRLYLGQAQRLLNVAEGLAKSAGVAAVSEAVPPPVKAEPVPAAVTNGKKKAKR